MKSQENPRTVSVSRHPKVSWAHKSQRTRTFKSQKAFQEPKKVPGFPKVTGHILFGLFGTMSIQNFSGPLKKTFKEPQKSQGYGLPKHHVSSVSGVLVPKIQEVIKYPGVLKSVRGQTKVKKQKWTSVSKRPRCHQSHRDNNSLQRKVQVAPTNLSI